MIITQTVPGTGTRDISYPWCDCGTLDRITYPSGFSLHDQCNNDRQLTAITVSNFPGLSNGSALVSYTYNTAGQLTHRTLADGAVAEYTLAMVGNLTEIEKLKARRNRAQTS